MNPKIQARSLDTTMALGRERQEERKSTDVALPTNVHLVKAVVFLVVMYECESWTVKKAERRSVDAFELWCWRRLLRVPWTTRRSNQSILMISPGILWKEWC